MSVDENQKKVPGDEPVSKGRRNRKQHTRYFHEVFEGILHGGSTLILLVALTAIIHHKEWFADSDEFFARKVAPYVSLDENELVKPVVQVIEVSAAARALYMEYVPARGGPDDLAGSRSKPNEFERTEGVRPIDRTRMAGLLTAIGKVLEAQKPTGSLPKVIGIDVDLAPLESDPEHPSNGIKEALDKLREIAPVVVISADRPPGKQREVRNGFMHEVNCTLPAAVEHSDSRKALYFASPSLFAHVGEAPFRFVAEVEDRKTTTPSSLPPIFPSLGTLMFLAVPANRVEFHQSWWGNFKEISADILRVPFPESFPPRPYHFKESIGDSEKFETLMKICLQAQPNGLTPSAAAIIQDALAENGGSNPYVESLKEVYRQPMYNWRLLNAAIVERTVLNQDDLEQLMQLKQGPKFDLQIANAEALVISIAGVGSVDKYFVPYLPSLSEQVPGGAMFHALTMASLEQSVREISVSGILIDVVIGSIFLPLSNSEWVKSARIAGRRVGVKGGAAGGANP